jgi:exodeoxyribonuclease V gamma subunit
MHVHTAEEARPLAAQLAEICARPLDDPFQAEWVAVPSEGMRRWLHLQLARHLGAGDVALGDGVVANVRTAFPGSLRARILGAEVGEEDPWQLERLTWAVLAVADAQPDHPATQAINDVAGGGSRYGRARRVADLFDRYHLHRPEMVRQWAQGNDADGSASSRPRRLASHHRWQPELWRLVAEHLGVPSPAERLPDLLGRVRIGDLVLDLPPRLSFFGLSVVPGGSGFVQVAEAVARHREVHLFLLEPSSAAATAVGAAAPRTVQPQPRGEDATAALVHHPLLRSWGRLHRETATLLADVREGDLFSPQWAAPVASRPPASLLQHLQAHIRADQEPGATVVVDAGDRSLQMHACYGPTRQVEVLRDAILQLLADPALGLSEDDIVVACPDLRRFAPLIEAVFGPSVDAWDRQDDSDAADQPPALRYRISDRTIRSTNPVLVATAALLDLLAGRVDAPTLLDFIALAPVRLRHRISEDDLAQIDDWVEEANVRWGLDLDHRARHGLPPTVTGNTWQDALDRVLVGAAVADDELALGPGEVAPLGVEGDRAALAGRLAEVVWRVGHLAREAESPRALPEWIALLQEATDGLFAAPRDADWQLENLQRTYADLLERSAVGAGPTTTPLLLADVRRLMSERLEGQAGRPDFFRGGITVSSLTPLRSLPARVVCLLGMDQAALTTRAVDGDDLVAAAPRIGDPDGRAEARLQLLEAVLAAEEHLVVVRDGHDVRTNQVIPPAVPVAELRDAVLAMVRPDQAKAVGEALEVAHPRQPFDDRNFRPGALGAPGAWSFDPGALAGAVARQDRTVESQPFLPVPLVRRDRRVVELDELQRFLKHPVRAFFEQRLEVRFPKGSESLRTQLPVNLGGLDRWKVGDRLLNALLDGTTVDEWLRVERRRGSLPPAALGDAAVAKLVTSTSAVVERAREHGLRTDGGEVVPVAVTLGDGTQVVGTVLDRLAPPAPGPVQVLFSRHKAEHRVRTWLELMALVGTDPGTAWRGVILNWVDRSRQPFTEVVLEPRADAADVDARQQDAVQALEVAVELFRRGGDEPLPLFPSMSAKVFEGKAGPSDWEAGSFGFSAETRDAATALAFAGLDHQAITTLPVRADDPAGEGDDRVTRYAHLLYGTLDRTAVDTSEPAKATR